MNAGPDKYEKMSLVSQARHAAVRRLRVKYQEEFDALYQEERLARGLSALTPPAEVEFLRRRVAELEGSVA